MEQINDKDNYETRLHDLERRYQSLQNDFINAKGESKLNFNISHSFETKHS